MEVCCTLGMLEKQQAEQLKTAGLTAYNHNLDTSREFYPSVISTRTYDERLRTLEFVRDAGISVCSGTECQISCSCVYMCVSVCVCVCVFLSLSLSVTSPFTPSRQPPVDKTAAEPKPGLNLNWFCNLCQEVLLDSGKLMRIGWGFFTH
jgi:hypothetical protein